MGPRSTHLGAGGKEIRGKLRADQGFETVEIRGSRVADIRIRKDVKDVSTLGFKAFGFRT